ncbi:MAG: hypothetical protein K2X62_11960 [Beijerinckiaceae bacterium]|nr:hypothetical protein [Beijerinckiaceae bacterium]
MAALVVAVAAPASAQTPDNPEIAACKATGLLALKETSPTVRDIVLDLETVTVSKANTKIEDTPVRTIIMGEVYLERKETGKAQHFLCIIGDKGKVLLTFFTAR